MAGRERRALFLRRIRKGLRVKGRSRRAIASVMDERLISMVPYALGTGVVKFQRDRCGTAGRITLRPDLEQRAGGAGRPALSSGCNVRFAEKAEPLEGRLWLGRETSAFSTWRRYHDKQNCNTAEQRVCENWSFIMATRGTSYAARRDQTG